MDIPFTIVATLFVIGCGWLFFALVVRLLKRRKSEKKPSSKSIQLTIDFDESVSSEKALEWLLAFADELQKAGGSLCDGRIDLDLDGHGVWVGVLAEGAAPCEERLENDPTVSIRKVIADTGMEAEADGSGGLD